MREGLNEQTRKAGGDCFCPSACVPERLVVCLVLPRMGGVGLTWMDGWMNARARVCVCRETICSCCTIIALSLSFFVHGWERVCVCSSRAWQTDFLCQLASSLVLTRVLLHTTAAQTSHSHKQT